MTTRQKFLIGLIALVVLGYFGFYVGITPHGTATRAQGELQQAAEAALANAGIDWVSVTMDGQKAVLGGTAPSSEAIDTAREAVLHAEWAGGLVGGGVTFVDVSGLRNSESRVLPIASPYTWSADLADDRLVTLRGYAPDEASRALIVARAMELFPRGVVDEMQLARGAASMDWPDVALAAVESLALLDQGTVSASDESFDVTGQTEKANNLATIEELFGKSPEGYNVTLTLKVNEPSASVIPAEPEVLAATPEAANECQSALNILINDNTINFRSSSAVILDNSLTVLSDLAATLRRCQNFTIEIAGHTDATGDDQLNLQLSQQRAQSVLTFLGANGVPVSRITAHGYGEAQPVASNQTRIGRATNRRIEFTVIE